MNRDNADLILSACSESLKSNGRVFPRLSRRRPFASPLAKYNRVDTEASWAIGVGVLACESRSSIPPTLLGNGKRPVWRNTKQGNQLPTEESGPYQHKKGELPCVDTAKYPVSMAGWLWE